MTKSCATQIRHQPLLVNLRASRALERLISWATLVVVGLLVDIAYTVPSLAQIVATGQLNIERRAHTATVLDDGKVLIVGGDNQSGMVSQAELLDPASQMSSLMAASIVARTDHTATRLSDGRVLIIGGRDQSGTLTSTEIYNPLTTTFTAGPSLMAPRSGHTATVLSDGKILIAGGDAGGSAEIYNPMTESFSPVPGSMNAGRKFHSAIRTSSGQVLIVGGVNAQNTVLNTAEVFDPTSQSFYLPPTDMQTPRALATLKLLADGKVQIIGGDAELSMEVFDPSNGIFIAKALLPPNANLLGATLSTQSRAALFSPLVLQDPLLQGVLTPEQSALLDRADQSITELPSRNQALVAGGINSAGQILNSAKLVSSSSASVTTDKTDYAPGQIVTITGSGFQPNEQVDIYFHEFPEEYPDIFLSAVANQQGNFVVAEFAPQQIDLGRIFTLTAIGQTSGFSAQTAFKDASLSAAPLLIRESTCTTAQSSFTTGDTVCARTTVVVTGNGSLPDVRIQWYKPDGTLVRDTLKSSVADNSTQTDTLALTASNAVTGTWTVKTCATSNAGACNSGNTKDTKTFTVTAAKATPVITFGEAPTPTFGGGNFTVSASTTNTDSSALTYSRVSGPCALVSGATFSSSGAGACVLRASGAETTNFLAASADQSVTINKAPVTATAGSGTGTYNGSTQSPSACAVTGAYTGDLTCANNPASVGPGIGTTPIVPVVSGTGLANFEVTPANGSYTINTGFAFNGFYSPIGGSVESGNGGSFADPVRSFKLGSTIPVKFGATWLNGSGALITGVQKLQAFKYSSATGDPTEVIDATPTDAATTGNEFRLTGTDWHFNLSTKSGFSMGTWLLRATLVDGSQHTVWVTIKK